MRRVRLDGRSARAARRPNAPQRRAQGRTCRPGCPGAALDRRRSIRRSAVVGRSVAARRRLAGSVRRLGGAGSGFLEAVADAVERLDHVEVVIDLTLNFLRSRLMWLSMVRSST